MTTAFSFAVLGVKGNTGAAVDSFLKELSVQIPKHLVNGGYCKHGNLIKMEW
jgi:hypothetical protein